MTKYRIELILSFIFFGTIGLMRKFIPYSSAFVSFARSLLGAICLIIWAVIKKDKINIKTLKKNIIPLIFSGVMICSDWILLFEAYKYTTISVATICYYLAPVLLIILSPVAFKEKITFKKAICCITALIGMMFVSGIIKTGFILTLTSMKGILLAFAAAVVYALIVIINKRITEIPTNERTIIQLLISSIVLFPYLFSTGEIQSLKFTFSVLLLVLIVGVFYTAVAYTFYFNGLSVFSSQTIAILSYIDPVVAVIVSAVILKEPFSFSEFIGVVLVIGAMLVSEIELKK